eukprot:3467198-Pyramimonas_sp.AAC.1
MRARSSAMATSAMRSACEMTNKISRNKTTYRASRNTMEKGRKASLQIPRRTIIAIRRLRTQF